MLDFSVLNSSVTNPTTLSILYAFLLSFILGTVMAVAYIRTFKGLSYSINFVHALVLFPIIIAIAMQAIGDNVARGIGMMGAMSLLRFRSNIKDTRDMFFIFAALTIGLACGVHSYGIAMAGTACLILTIGILENSPFSSGPQFDGLLRLNLSKNSEDQRKVEELIAQNSRHFALLTIKEVTQGERLEFAYQIRLKPNVHSSQVIDSIGKVESVRGLQFMNQESVVEV